MSWSIRASNSMCSRINSLLCSLLYHYFPCYSNLKELRATILSSLEMSVKIFGWFFHSASHSTIFAVRLSYAGTMLLFITNTVVPTRERISVQHTAPILLFLYLYKPFIFVFWVPTVTKATQENIYIYIFTYYCDSLLTDFFSVSSLFNPSLTWL